MEDTFRLSQKLYLLAIHPEKGGIIMASQTALPHILSGALILELLLNKNISLSEKSILFENDNTAVPVHRIILEKIRQRQPPASIAKWISRLNSSQKIIRTEIQKELVEMRLIKMEPRKFLFFKWQKPQVINKQMVYHLVNEVKNLLLKSTDNEEEVIFLSLVKPSGILKRIYPDRHERKTAAERLKKVTTNNQVSEAVSQAIAAAQIVAATAAMTAATAASHR